MLKPFKALALAGAMLSLALSAAAQPAAGPGSFADVDGGRIYYETCGSDGPAIVLLHDGVAHSAGWDGVWPLLCKDFHVVRYDRRGYGRSPEAKAAYSPLDDLKAVMAAAKIDHAAMVGSSNGGGLAIDFTLLHPEAVDHLVVVGPEVSGLRYSEHFLRRLTELSQMIGQGDLMGAIKASWMMAPGHDADARRLLEMVLANPQNLTHKDPIRPAVPAAPRLGSIRAPTLVLVGEADIADNQSQAGVVEYAIPHARRIVVRDAGHMMYMEHPDVFAGLVSRFVRGEAP